MCDQQSLRSACAGQSLCQLLEYYMSVKILTEHHLEFLSLKGGCVCSSESTYVNCHIVGNHMSWLIIVFMKKCFKTDTILANNSVSFQAMN